MATNNLLRRPTNFRTANFRTGCLLSFMVLLIILAALSLSVGAHAVSFSDLIMGLQGHIDTIGQSAVNLRIPRTILAVLAGSALGLAGAVMQGITRNPLADPGILGVNMGASLAIVIGIAWFQIASPSSFIWIAILGAGLTAVFVYLVGSMGRDGATPLKLALAGTATSIAFSSLVVAIVLPRNDIAGSVRAWQIGGIGGANFDYMIYGIPFLVVGCLICLLGAGKLNLLALDDDVAKGLGENVVLSRIILSLGAVLLCGATTALCGPIGFVGLIVPHFCRLLVGVNYRWLLPFSVIIGACLLLSSDIVGRIIAAPSELDVGIITAFVGAPFFIYIVRQKKVREL